MHPTLLLLVTLWTSSAFFPGALDRQLAATERRHLPVAFALAEANRLRIDFHHDREALRATYLGPDATGPARLTLYAPDYLRGFELKPVLDMPVDLCENFFYALLDAHLRRQIGLPPSALGRELRRRAELTMSDVPHPHRVEAYLDAQASFGAHLLSVANELDRSELRRRRAGSSLCRVMNRPLPLVGLWEQIFGPAPYTGAYVRGGPRGEGRVYWSRASLTADDKRFLLTRVLHSTWTGSASDLVTRYCN